MEKTLRELDLLQLKINSEKDKYKNAIKTNQTHEEVKTIYRKIKELEKHADALMEKANKLHEG